MTLVTQYWQLIACGGMVVGSVFMGLMATIYQNKPGIKYSFICFMIAVSAALIQTGS